MKMLSFSKFSIALISLIGLSISIGNAQAITYKQYLDGVDMCSARHLSNDPISKSDYAAYLACSGGHATDWVSMNIPTFRLLNPVAMTVNSQDNIFTSTVLVDTPVSASNSSLNVFILDNISSSTGIANQDSWTLIDTFEPISLGQWNIEIDASIFKASNSAEHSSLLAFSSETDSINFQEMSNSKAQNFGLQQVFVKVPEPTTILGSLIILSFGIVMKRRLR